MNNALREKQIDFAKYKKSIISIKEITTLPKDYLAERDSLLSFSVIKKIESQDKKTIKILAQRVSDSLKFESVLMRYKDGRNSACVSSMVGCPLNCRFCATGKMGFKANLTEMEIADQVVFWNNFLLSKSEKITNVVFMGMGEPLLNIENVLSAISIITEKIGMANSRITISTAGVIKGIERLTAIKYKGELAISLHSAVQANRQNLMPIAITNKLDDLKRVLVEFQRVTKNRITLEYILIEDFNVSSNDALELKRFTDGLNVLINLIPYNDIGIKDLRRPSNNKIFKFKRELENIGLNVTLRYTMGDDNLAACGQLYAKN